MPAGRPTSYKPEYCDKVIELGKQGCSMVEIAVELGVPRTTMLSWADSHAEFSTALSMARDCAQAWWESTGRSGLVTPSFNGFIWKTTMQARFRDDYTERKEITGGDGGPLQVIVQRFSE
jgi:hypothetical protein